MDRNEYLEHWQKNEPTPCFQFYQQLCIERGESWAAGLPLPQFIMIIRTELQEMGVNIWWLLNKHFEVTTIADLKTQRILKAY